MGKFIEEFYYGNIDPQARSTKENKAVQKQMEVLMLNEDFLSKNSRVNLIGSVLVHGRLDVHISLQNRFLIEEMPFLLVSFVWLTI